MTIHIITLSDKRARVVVNGAIIATAANIAAACDIVRAIVAAENMRQSAAGIFEDITVQEFNVKF